MRKLPEAISDLQVACMQPHSTFLDLARCRLNLIAAIREAILASMLVAKPNISESEAGNYIAKFDKLLTPP